MFENKVQLLGDGDDNTTDLHFGGFLAKNEGQQMHERSGKDILDDIVAKSKLEKVRLFELKIITIVCIVYNIHCAIVVELWNKSMFKYP